MKLLCLCSALDIGKHYGCTPAWWQFLKGMYELGHDVIAIPYAGAAFESPYWRGYANPCAVEGQAFATVKKWFGGGATSVEEGAGAKVTKAMIEGWVKPRWENHLTTILAREKNVDAVIVFNVPANHFTGIPGRLRARYGVPFFYYDGDVPASLPRFGGFSTGFKIYEGTNLAEYDGFMCNSEGGAEELAEMGAVRVKAVHWGVDPELYARLPVEEERDVFFYGIGMQFREDWIHAMLTQASESLADKSFCLGGTGFPETLGKVVQIGNVPFNQFRYESCRSRLNLNIVRGAHASVLASSTSRPFELSAMSCCVITSPYEGVERWFDIGNEMIMVNTPDEVVDVYRCLLNDNAERRRIAEAARKRVIAQHTHRHRAEEITAFVMGF
ncbi:MAG: hypothetical protein AMXMBFR84_21040 [Candidatus Hydrogenedentota bacterium]